MLSAASTETVCLAEAVLENSLAPLNLEIGLLQGHRSPLFPLIMCRREESKGISHFLFVGYTKHCHHSPLLRDVLLLEQHRQWAKRTDPKMPRLTDGRL